MFKIDAHQHFWQYDPIRDAWIDETMQVIQRDFMPKDLKPLLDQNGIVGCVAVQADQSEAESNFLLELAAGNPFIKGVVGWVDLRSADLPQSLKSYSSNPLFKGVRHIAQAERDDFLMRSDVQAGIAQLAAYGLTYDILIYAHQLPAAIKLVAQFPDQAFVLDHLAKPSISKGLNKDWMDNIQKLAKHSNVYCKLSGMVTETNKFLWKKPAFSPFIDVILEAFGTDRVMYGSDWPVCLLAAQYREQILIIEDHIASFSPSERAKIMGMNAVAFYNLSIA
ncbi:MAG: amidohydrolase family protein [Bacteroidota bacterium]